MLQEIVTHHKLPGKGEVKKGEGNNYWFIEHPMSSSTAEFLYIIRVKRREKKKERERRGCEILSLTMAHHYLQRERVMMCD